MISFVALILSMSVPDSIGSFRTVWSNPVIRDTACQSSMTADVKENIVLEKNIISYGSFSDKNR